VKHRLFSLRPPADFGCSTGRRVKMVRWLRASEAVRRRWIGLGGNIRPGVGFREEAPGRTFFSPSYPHSAECGY